MNIFVELKIALRNLRKNISRTILSISGITVGITTIIIVLSIGSALNELILGQVKGLGADTLFVEVKVPTGKKESKNAMAMAQGVQITTLKRQDADEVALLPNIAFNYAATTGQATTVYRDNEQKIIYWATTERYPEINNINPAQGRFFSGEEEKSLAKVAVLGYEIAQELFEDEDPVNKMIKINKQSFKVIGVMEKKGVQFFTNVDRNVYLPLKTAQKLLLGVDHILFMGIKMEDKKKQNQTVDAINNLLLQRHDISDPEKADFAVRTLDEALSILESVTLGITVLLLLVAGISLVVGGVGIMNVMYVSVSERTHEIGLLKAIGAKRKSILNQFILEATVITLLGGVFGIALGTSVSFLVSVIAQTQGLDWVFIISLQSILFAVLTSGFIGLTFGYYPAKKASLLQPIDALRWE